MKRLLSLMIVALFATMQVMAQTSSATLVHDGTLSSFTGENALSEAVAAATDGDIITLSAGTFKGCRIEKAIILRGAGMEADELGRQTTISSDLNLCITDGKDKSFSIEGVFMPSSKITSLNLGSFYMNKCTVQQCFEPRSSATYSYVISHTVITNCKIRQIANTRGAVNVYNSLVGNAEWASSNRFDNCVVLFPTSAGYYGEFNNSILLFGIAGGGSLFKGTADHCVANYTFKAENGSNNYVVSGENEVFSNYDSNAVWYTRDLTLTDEAKAKYLGSDGTEVGIYGGNLSFSPYLDQPFIKRLKVAPRSTREGKLSVDIEVGE